MPALSEFAVLKSWYFEANLKSVEELYPQILQCLQEADRKQQMNRLHVELVLRELLTNCVVHSAADVPSFCGKLTALQRGVSLAVEISHNGCTFRLSDFPQVLHPTGHIRTHGRGWWILRHFVPRIRLSGDGREIHLQLITVNPANTEIMPLLHATRQEDTLVLRFPQSITALNGSDFRTELKEVLAEGPATNVAADFEQVFVIDSHGIGVLSALYNTLKKKKASFRVINTSPEVAYLLKSMRLDHYFPIELRPEASDDTQGDDHESL
jgi:serine/threonine-protein kinase RsbW